MFRHRLHKLGQTSCESFDVIHYPVQTCRRSRARTGTCARIARIPVSPWSSDRRATCDFVQKSQNHQVRFNFETSTVPHVTLLPVSHCGLQNNTETNCSSFPTLYRDTRDFIHNISALKTLPEHYLVRLDIEEFFMSGDPGILACDGAGLKRVRGNDYYARLTVSFSLTSLWPRDAILKGDDEYK